MLSPSLCSTFFECSFDLTSVTVMAQFRILSAQSADRGLLDLSSVIVTVPLLIISICPFEMSTLIFCGDSDVNKPPSPLPELRWMRPNKP